MNHGRKIVPVACVLAVLVALLLPIAATAEDTKNNGSGKANLPAVVIETEQYKCHEKPPVCNCMGADNCKALEASGYCKPTTYNFWDGENLGTCVWTGKK